jgi:hypothetical protein
MEFNSFQLNATQLVALVLSAALLMVRPEMAILVALFAGLNLSFSMSAMIAISQRYRGATISELPVKSATILGTHFGGILCYLVLIAEAFNLMR